MRKTILIIFCLITVAVAAYCSANYLNLPNNGNADCLCNETVKEKATLMQLGHVDALAVLIRNSGDNELPELQAMLEWHRQHDRRF